MQYSNNSREQLYGYEKYLSPNSKKYNEQYQSHNFGIRSGYSPSEAMSNKIYLEGSNLAFRRHAGENGSSKLNNFSIFTDDNDQESGVLRENFLNVVDIENAELTKSGSKYFESSRKLKSNTEKINNHEFSKMEESSNKLRGINNKSVQEKNSHDDIEEMKELLKKGKNEDFLQKMVVLSTEIEKISRAYAEKQNEMEQLRAQVNYYKNFQTDFERMKNDLEDKEARIRDLEQQYRLNEISELKSHHYSGEKYKFKVTANPDFELKNLLNENQRLKESLERMTDKREIYSVGGSQRMEKYAEDERNSLKSKKLDLPTNELNKQQPNSSKKINNLFGPNDEDLDKSISEIYFDERLVQEENFNALKEKITDLENKLLSAVSDNERLNEVLCEKSHEVDIYKNKFTQLERNIFEQQNVGIEKLTRVKVEADGEIELWRTRLLEAEKKSTLFYAENESLRAKLINLEKTNQINSNELMSTQIKMESWEEQLNNLKKDRENYRQKLSLYEKELKVKEKLLSENKIEALEELALSKQKLSERESQIYELKEEIHLQSLKFKEQEKFLKEKDLQDPSAAYVNRIKGLQDELEETKRELADLRRKIQNSPSKQSSIVDDKSQLELKEAYSKLKEKEEIINKLAYEKETLLEMKRKHDEEKKKNVFSEINQLQLSQQILNAREIEQSCVYLSKQVEGLTQITSQKDQEIELWKNNYVSIDQFYKKQIEEYDQKLKSSEMVFNQELRNQLMTKSNDKDGYVNSLLNKIAGLEQTIYNQSLEKMEARNQMEALRKQSMERSSINNFGEIQAKFNEIQGKCNILLQENYSLKQIIAERSTENEKNKIAVMEMKGMYANMEKNYRSALIENERMARIITEIRSNNMKFGMN